MTHRKVFEMGLDLRDIDRTMPTATQGYALNKSNSGYQLVQDDKTVNVSVTEQAPRVIAGLSLPVTQVELLFEHHSTQNIEDFMFRFMRHFHRGGG